ncbi:MAG: heavy-metal-associated domain-containing protein [bacterium]|nr:MAG: heavy-metal-associated domain-containing protein [bacterium]
MEVTIKVPDMTCDHCKMTIDKALKGVAGVTEVQVLLTEHWVKVSGKSEVNRVIQAIQSAGYTAEEIVNLKP